MIIKQHLRNLLCCVIILLLVKNGRCSVVKQAKDKKGFLHVAVSEAQKAKLAKVAEAECRTMSSLTRKILSDYVKAFEGKNGVIKGVENG